MKILGVNAGRAAPPGADPARRRPLADGSAALLIDGRIACAALEERHSRERYAGGFKASAPIVLAEGGCAIDELDAIGLSTCCDSPWKKEADRLDAVVEELHGQHVGVRQLRDRLRGRVHAVDHHDSHATLAFVGSGFAKSLVCVMDGFGNRLDDPDRFHVGPDWWRGSFDRQTIYVAEWQEGAVKLERVHQSAAHDQRIGLAELYRGVTHFLGWPSYQFAGKTMALASYGDPAGLPNLRLIELDSRGGIRVKVTNRHDDPVAQISEVLHQAGYSVPKDLVRPASPEEPFLANLAALLQAQVETAIIDLVGAMADRHGVDCVALAGGVALNCIAMGRLARARPDLKFYVPPAPGDTGQGLGNALWLAYARQSPVRERAIARPMRSAALGPRYDPCAANALAEAFVTTDPGLQLHRLNPQALADAVANLIARGRSVGVRAGRAEYGPRALGQTSILADPRQASAKDRVNRVKRREAFRPFAASVLGESAAACFPGAVPSPFMSFAAVGSDDVQKKAPGVVHIDGTTRYQTVEPDAGLLHDVLIAFRDLTGLPLILNTSFNLSGEPMVETPSEALDAFDRCALDAVVVGDALITRHEAVV